jgi:hypothetical protein
MIGKTGQKKSRQIFLARILITQFQLSTRIRVSGVLFFICRENRAGLSYPLRRSPAFPGQMAANGLKKPVICIISI